MLEIARQSVPDGYGNSYFWVKPPRIVPRDLVKGVEGRLDVNGEEVRPFDEDGARAVARWFKAQGVDTLGVCFLHAYANPAHEERMRAVLLEEHPDAVVSPVQRGAARVPRVRARDDHARRRGGEAAAVGVRHEHQEPARRRTTTGRSRST